MQINPFGFPLGAAMPPAPVFGGANLGFADALGMAIGGGVPQPAIGTGTPAIALPPSFQTQLTGTLAAQPQAPNQPAVAPSLLPGMPQPTPLSQLMATAAKLPTAEQPPVAADETPGIASEAPSDAVVIEFPAQPAAAAKPAAPIAAPANSNVPLPDAVPANNNAPANAEGDAQAKPSKAAKPAEPAAARPRKGMPIEIAADAPAQPADATVPVPTEMLAALAAQPVAQPQVAPRTAAATTEKAASGISAKKAPGVAVAADAAAQPATADTTADFARAVSARGHSADTQDQGDSPGQPEHKIATAKLDLAAPAMPTHTAAPSVGASAKVLAPEPLIEARAGHLGHTLGVEIARKVDMGEETLRVRLNPVELGRVEVTLAFDDRGSLQATVRAESPKALDLLRQDAPDLQRTLDQAGVRTDAQSFRFESRSGDSGGQQAQQQQSQNRGRFASSDDDAGAAEAIYRPVRNDGQVDLLA